ncbi:MAG: NAD-dependent epimerase/dehydratase family protein [Gemmatimonadaceae bacterium]
MKVLVTGGTGVVGSAAVRHLIARGHTVRLFSRNANRDCEAYVDGVEPWAGSVGEPETVHGCAAACDAVLHIVGIVAESPPDVTFEKVNVQGTRHMVEEAERQGIRRFIYVSSLGADRGRSDYHRSKKRAELEAQKFSGDWLIMRPGNVYGPGDEVISLLLKMVRTLPAIPVIDDGDQQFQPVWTDDLGDALAQAVEREDLARHVLELSGTELTCTNEVLDLLAEITGKKPPRLPLPGWLASTGAKVASAFGVDSPVSADQITMVVEGNVISPGEPNALTDVFGITPTPLKQGLKRLADVLPEQLPSDGVGRLVRRRYWADIRNAPLSPEALMERFRSRFAALTPSATVDVGAEPGTQTTITEGATITLGLRMRGTVQVRVIEVTEREVTLVTVEGHPLAGAIRFRAFELDDELRFQVTTYDRPANLVDWVAMSTIGIVLKSSTWRALVEAVVTDSGGVAPDGVQTESKTLDDDQAEVAEKWVERLVMERKREESEGLADQGAGQEGAIR